MNQLGKNRACLIINCSNKSYHRTRVCRLHYEELQTSIPFNIRRQTYMAYWDMIKKAKSFKKKVCPRWDHFTGFLLDMGPKENRGDFIELKEGAEIFDKDNCQWVASRKKIGAPKKVSPELAEKIREEYQPGVKNRYKEKPDPATIKALSEKYKISTERIHKIVHGLYWNS